MPAFNESEGIEEFITEIANCISTELTFVVVDDTSTDTTFQVIEKLAKSKKIILHRNKQNLGHGPSTIAALRLACKVKCDYVISTDGDGQFQGKDFQRLLITALDGKFEIVEGVRTSRNDPLYRKLPSLVTRLIVFAKSARYPKDGNTPLRLYRREMLEKILQATERNLYVPNVFISSVIRKNNFYIGEIEVLSLPRRGKNKVGTMWKSKNNSLPPKKFIKFCLSSFLEIMKEKIPII
jgi:dolichol-phosphate mannosyltransferase